MDLVNLSLFDSIEETLTLFFICQTEFEVFGPGIVKNTLLVQGIFHSMGLLTLVELPLKFLIVQVSLQHCIYLEMDVACIITNYQKRAAFYFLRNYSP